MCERNEETELVEVFANRKYRLRCTHCGASFVLTGSQDKEDEKKEEK